MLTFESRSLAILVLAIVLVSSVPASGAPAAGPGEVTSLSCPELNDGTEPAIEGLDTYSDASDRSSSGSSVITVTDTTPLTSVVFLASYSRYDGSDPLEHEVRNDLHEAILRSPGSYVTELGEMNDVPRSTLRYHLRILEREGLVYAETILGNLRYYPAGSDVDELAVALESEATAAVLDAVERLEPVSVTTVAAELDRSPSTISYHLDRLEDEGLVERERDGEAVLTRLTPDAKTERGPSTDQPSIASGAHSD